MTRPFTGRHMLGLMLAFFGVIVSVNFVMASYAASTFGGVVVDNSYVASQRFNGWLEQARAQEQLGWRVETGVDAAARLRVALRDRFGGPVAGAISVVARHPLGRVPDHVVAMRRDGDGYRGDTPLPAGRWLLRIDVRAGGHAARFEEEVNA